MIFYFAVETLSFERKTDLILAGEGSVRQVVRREVGRSQLRGHEGSHRGHRQQRGQRGGDVGGDVEVAGRGPRCHQSR